MGLGDQLLLVCVCARARALGWAVTGVICPGAQGLPPGSVCAGSGGPWGQSILGAEQPLVSVCPGGWAVPESVCLGVELRPETCFTSASPCPLPGTCSDLLCPSCPMVPSLWAASWSHSR